MPHRRRRLATAMGAVAILAAGTAPAVALAPPTLTEVDVSDLDLSADDLAELGAAKTTGKYIVMMNADPVVAYDGDLPGLAATAPPEGEPMDPTDDEVERYREHLDRMGDAILRRSGLDAADKTYDYSISFPGFSAEMTEAEADQLATDDMVVAVVPDELRQLQTDTTPEFLGLLDSDEGLWRAQKTFGEDVVVGVIDSGIWPESPSFTDRARSGPGVGERFTYVRPPERWEGECSDADDEWDASLCNRKLIGAQWYGEAFGVERIQEEFPLEYLSPRDADGHGTHVASTAAGNQFVETEFGRISGIAPRARVAAYKVCWGYEGAGGCSAADMVAAIDQAVADGVDVINMSIGSGTESPILDPVGVSMLFAADAGVVFNASAGNSGPGASTMDNTSPWINTVGASTESSALTGTVTLGNGDTYEGASSQGNPGTDELPLVASRDIAADGVDEEDAALCLEDSLADATDRMVLCERGAIARTAKSAEVARAGGEAMILGNVEENTLNADAHSVPSVHVQNDATEAIQLYIESTDTASTTASLSPAERTDVVAPDVAAFSSRGPSLANNGDVLKPDLIAPGVNVLAAYSPTIGGREFDFLSGTSMSSPHAAGLSALITEAHPDWSAAAMQSAMMTTAYQTRTDDSPIPGTPFDWGSGHIQPNTSVDPGLVYDAGLTDWLGYACGNGDLVETFCEDRGIDVLDPSDLNEPNIAIGELAGEQTVTRTVTNVDDEPGLYTASVEAPKGMRVEVVPDRLLLQPGQSKSFEVTFTVMASANIGETGFGELTWSDEAHEVTSRLVATPVAVAAPAVVPLTGTDGETEFEATFGFNGPVTVAPHGLVPATRSASTVVDDPANDIVTALDTGVGITAFTYQVGEGQAYARLALRNELTDGEDDLDLYVFGPDGALVGSSGGGTAAEQVDLVLPAPGGYTVIVHGWQTDGPDADFTLLAWQFSATPGSDNLTVDGPSRVEVGETVDIGVGWSDLESDESYLGAVSYSDANGLVGLTLLEVETGGPGG